MHYRRQVRAANPALRKREQEYTKQWKAANPEAHAAQQARKHVKQKKERNAYVAQWKKDNKKEYNAYLSFCKKRVKHATPKWLDKSSIVEIFKNRPDGCHVDHIIPINHPDVCGLNVPWNLQYLTDTENLEKSNKFDINNPLAYDKKVK